MDRLLKDAGFRIHLIVYAAVNTLLMVINLMSSTDGLWFQWPLLGWGIGIVGHAILLLTATPSGQASSPPTANQE